MTPRQKECLDFIEAYIAENGFSPSFSEIARGIGYGSKSNVSRVIRNLSTLGYIKFHPGRARGIDLCDRTKVISELCDVLEEARFEIELSRDAVFECSTVNGEFDRQSDADFVAEYDALLARIDGVLKQAEAAS